jgi:glycerophosphoryl diester phosphodiesterase
MLMAVSISLLLYSQQNIPECHIKEPGNEIYVVAHRGAHKGIPENSLAAYQKAIDIGCDFVEIDIRTTKDGKFVSIHNSKVDEYTAGSKGKVSEMNLDELRSLDIGIKTGPERKGTKIPTFEEILELCKGKTGIYLDLKAAPVTQLVDIIKKYGMEKDIIWYISSSDTKDIDELRTSCPDCLLMPDPGAEENIKTVASKFHPCILATDMDKLGEKFVNTAHLYNTMVISDEKAGTENEWRQMLEWKTDGIQTDNPEELISFLKSRKQ